MRLAARTMAPVVSGNREGRAARVARLIAVVPAGRTGTKGVEIEVLRVELAVAGADAAAEETHLAAGSDVFI